jgi:hypothetical protein
MPDDQLVMPPEATQSVSLQVRLERALLVLAYFIELDGDAHVALFQRLEEELAELRRRESAKDRARRLLDGYSSRAGDLKAIRSRYLSLSSSEGPRPYLGL